ncbi:3-dehydroquinate synthase [compost metagenome]
MRQVRSGWAEVLKHGLICDAAFFDWLGDMSPSGGAAGAKGDPDALERAVIRSVEIKSQIVSEDEKEAGRRALLNLGHTFGHALEAELGFGDALTHGEAVALGCAMAFRYSARQGLCPTADAEKAEAGIKAAGLPTRLDDIDQVFNVDALIGRMAGDKKAEGGRLTLILARAIGDAFTDKDVDANAVRAFLIEEGAAA